MTASKYFGPTGHFVRSSGPPLPALAAVDQDEPAGQVSPGERMVLMFCVLCAERGWSVVCPRCHARRIPETVGRARPSAACFGVQTDASARGWGVDSKQ